MHQRRRHHDSGFAVELADAAKNRQTQVAVGRSERAEQEQHRGETFDEVQVEHEQDHRQQHDAGRQHQHRLRRQAGRHDLAGPLAFGTDVAQGAHAEAIVGHQGDDGRPGDDDGNEAEVARPQCAREDQQGAQLHGCPSRRGDPHQGVVAHGYL